MADTIIRTTRDLVDYAATLDCIHCGLCLESCPTYNLTGAESSSPRGRIHLMRAVAEENLEPDAEYRDEMEFCLVCRHCESVCPAGIHMGEMMSVARDAMYRAAPRPLLERLARWIGFRCLLPSRTALRVFGSLLRLGQRTGILALKAQASPFGNAQLNALVALPPVPAGSERSLLPRRLPATGAATKSTAPVVSMLEGCVMPELYSGVNYATARVLTRLGSEVKTTRDSVCCGALHAHNGDLEGARSLAKKMIRAYQRLDESGQPTPIVVNSAGCGAHMKELAHLFEESDGWHQRAAEFSKRVVDFSEYVAPLIAEAEPSLVLKVEGAVTWDNPCHLCHGQGIREQPLDLLKAVELPNGELVELANAESCCGSAGIYSALRPDDSADILNPKLDALEQSGAKTLVTSNPGCQMQWQSGIAKRALDVKVKHLAEVLDEALRESDFGSRKSR